MFNKIRSASTIVLFLLFTACSKDNATGEVTTNYLTVKIDGKEKNFSDVRGRWVDGGNFLEITASNSGDEWLTFTVMSNSTRVSAGQYSLDDASGFTLISTYSPDKNKPALNYAATRGTLALEDAFALDIKTINNSTVNGSFNGVLVRVEGATTLGQVTLTDGKFNTAIVPN